MTQFYKPTLVEIIDDQIVIDIKNISELGGINYAVVSVNETGTNYMTIGNSVFKVEITGNKYQANGSAEASESGKSFIIKLPGIKNITRLD
jgi:hypothetical protein